MNVSNIDFTSYETRQIVTFVTSVILQPSIFALGIIANLTNITIFVKLGLKDSISICFFVLSCTDLVCVLLVTIGNATTGFSDYFQTRWGVVGEDITWVIMGYYGPFYDISQGITTFIAVQKCWCVALPFRFKNTFTTGRTTVILTGMILALLSMHVPILASQFITETFDPVLNRTRFKLWTAEDLGKTYSAVGMVSLVFTNICQFTVIFCLVILTSSLRASSKFRNSTLINTKLEHKVPKTKMANKLVKKYLTPDAISSNNQCTDPQAKITANKISVTSTTSHEDINPVALPAKTNSRKELLAIKSTTFVSFLFVSFNMLKLLNYYVIICIPEYSILGYLVHTYFVTNEMRFTLELLHCSCNTFIYVKFNSRYRSTLLSVCARGR